MSFVLFGPGISDHLTLNQALAHPVLQVPPQAIDPVQKTRAIQTAEQGAGFEVPEQESPPNSPKFAAEMQAYQVVRHAQREVSPVQVAEQIMTSPVISLPPDAPILELRRLFDGKKFGLVPLLNAEKQLVGIVTKGDLTRQRVRFTDLAPRPVATIANPKVLTATTQTNIRELARVLLAQDIRGLPIVDDRRQVVGVVTRGDILRALVNYAPLELWL
ncbi:MAG: CBS domain-containing protein [Halothiobacillus sp.]